MNIIDYATDLIEEYEQTIKQLNNRIVELEQQLKEAKEYGISNN